MQQVESWLNSAFHGSASLRLSQRSRYFQVTHELISKPSKLIV